jgi:FkbM family methyltransferase
MRTNTKALFISILKAQRADCVCDIGSRDGDQSLLFRHALPAADVLAFEANPINFKAMQVAPHLAAERIELFPFAISNRLGKARFHVADVDYSDRNANRGTSSLLTAAGQKVQSTVEVPTHRIDDLILGRPVARHRIGLWIDVEGAEYEVLEGMPGIADRVVAVHVETSNEPRWDGQKPLRDLVRLMTQHGFRVCGKNFGDAPEAWGDVVFVRDEVARRMGMKFGACQAKARASYLVRADNAAVLLKARAPWLYRTLRRLYIRFGT